MARRYTHEYFIEKAVEVHGLRYSYGNTVYKNTRTKVIITCHTHGDFTQSPVYHLKGAGCPKCARKLVTEGHRYDTTTFIQKALIAHNGKYSYDNTVYVSAHSKVTITCSIHGDFTQTPGSHLNGSGCRLCAIANNSIATRCEICTDRPTTLYYVYFPDYHVWKIGCTTVGVLERFKAERTEIEIIYTKVYDNSAEAYLVEKYILQATGKYAVTTKVLKKGGNSELRDAAIENIEDLVAVAEQH